MVKMSMVYEGDLRCRLTHGPSGKEILTDAPVDNQGKGEAFSPTDLVGAALGSCILTVMGIAARKNNIKIEGAKASVEKEMVVMPIRKIGKISVTIDMPSGLTVEQRAMLEHIAHTSPVHQSLHPDVKMLIVFQYPD